MQVCKAEGGKQMVGDTVITFSLNCTVRMYSVTAFVCNMLHNLIAHALSLQSFPMRPASSAARLFPVAEEQLDSFPVLCEKKHWVCPPSLLQLAPFCKVHTKLLTNIFVLH